MTTSAWNTELHHDEGRR